MASVIQKFDLGGKTAIVTGAGFGLGRVFAETLAEAGASVIVTDRDAAGAEETVGLIDAAGGKAAMPASLPPRRGSTKCRWRLGTKCSPSIFPASFFARGR